MSEPVAERIMAAVKSRLSAYTTTHRSQRVASWQPKDMVIHVFQDTINENEEVSCPGNPPAQGFDLNVVVAGLIKPSDSDLTAVDTFKNRFWSEIVKAITNADLWWNWGGLAINTKISQVEEHTDDDGAFAGVKVSMVITFRTDETNPYTARA